MKKILLLITFFVAAIATSQTTYDISVEGSKEIFTLRVTGSSGAPMISWPAEDTYYYLDGDTAVRFTRKSSLHPLGNQLGYRINTFTISESDPLFATLGGTIDNYAEFKQWAEENLGFNPATGGSVAVGESNTVSLSLVSGSQTIPGSPYAHITESHRIVDGHEDAYLQGGWHLDATYNSTLGRQFPSSTDGSGGNLTTLSAQVWVASFKVTGDFAIRVDGSDSVLSGHRIWIDGQTYSLSNPLGLGGGTRWYGVLAGPGLHYVKVLGFGNVRWYGYNTAPEAYAAPWNATKTTFVFGDSFTASTGATVRNLAFSYFLKENENHNIVASGVGGTGYVNDATTRNDLETRIATDLENLISENGMPDEIIIAMGINDIGRSGIEAACDAVFDEIRSQYAGPVFVVSPFDSAAPSAVAGNYTTAKNAILAAIVGRSGFYWIDMQGFFYTKSDATHPNDAGHAAIGNYIKSHLTSYPLTNVQSVLADLQARILKLEND